MISTAIVRPREQVRDLVRIGRPCPSPNKRVALPGVYRYCYRVERLVIVSIAALVTTAQLVART
jgi:hypothetical protein